MAKSPSKNKTPTSANLATGKVKKGKPAPKGVKSNRVGGKKKKSSPGIGDDYES